MLGWLVLVLSTIVVVWLFGRVSKWATALSAAGGLAVLAAGCVSEDVRLALFGGGLLLFSGLINFVFNGDRW